jgi:hypothetical protein
MACQVMNYLRMMTWKGCGRKQLKPILKYYSSFCLEGVRETTKNLSQDSQSIDQDFDQGPAKYEVQVIIAQLQHSEG